jgi:hypothetical protein
MKLTNIFTAFFIVLVGFSLSACVNSSAEFSSNKLSNYNGSIKRLLVYADIGDILKNKVDGDEELIFADKLIESLRGCAIAAEYHAKNRIALQDERGSLIGAFAADAFLDIQLESATKSNKEATKAVYILSLSDVSTKRLVWKAQLNFVSAWYGGETLAAALINKLKADSMISQSCVAPIVPKA